MTYDHLLFNEIMRRIDQGLGYKVYDYKPLDDVPYPFVGLERTHTLHRINKFDVKGEVIVSLSIWGLQKRRKEISTMATEVYKVCRKITHLDGFKFEIDDNASDIQIIDDTTTSTPLKRAMITINYKIK